MSTEEDIELYILKLQKIIDINSASEVLCLYTDSVLAKKWKKILKKILSQNYKLITE